MKRIIWIFLTIIWIVFIFYNSSRIGLESANTSSSIVEVIQSILSKFGVSISWNTLSLIIRKGAHFFEFFILAILFYNVLKIKLKYNIKVNYYIILLGFCLLIALIDEFIQYYVPRRASSIIDVLIDFSGSVLAVLFIIIIKQKFIKSTLNKH